MWPFKKTKWSVIAFNEDLRVAHYRSFDRKKEAREHYKTICVDEYHITGWGRDRHMTEWRVSMAIHREEDG